MLSDCIHIQDSMAIRGWSKLCGLCCSRRSIHTLDQFVCAANSFMWKKQQTVIYDN